MGAWVPLATHAPVAQRGTAWHRVGEAAGTRAEPGQMGMWCREKQGALSCANPGRIYARTTSHTTPPADLAPRAAGAQGQGGGLAPWPCHTASPGGGLGAMPGSCCHLGPVASGGHLETCPPCPPPAGRTGGCVPVTPVQGRARLHPGSGLSCAPVPQGQRDRRCWRLAGAVGSSIPGGLPRRLASTAPAACWPAPSVPGLSRGGQGQPGGISPLCHPAVALRAPKQRG